MYKYKLFIDNMWVDSNSKTVIEVENPANREIIGAVCRGDKQDVDAAVVAARKAVDDWSALEQSERSRYMRRLGDAIERKSEEIAEVITMELGMPHRYCKDYHVLGAVAQAYECAVLAENYTYEKINDGNIVIKEPYGVVAGITPWNYPLTQISSKLFAAMVVGNTVILKPSRNTPLCSMKLAECVLEAGFPQGVFNVVTGVGAEIGNALALHPDIDALSFTGSTSAGIDVGQKSMTTVKKVTLELGGKSPLILLESGDAEAAVRKICADVFMNSGQTCCAYTRFIVPESMKTHIDNMLVEEAKKYIVGNPMKEDTMIGPLINEKAFNKVKEYIEIGIKEGATMLVGEVPELTKNGYYVRPTIFTDVTNDMTIAREEIFGPVLSVITYNEVDKAIEIANDTKYGLAGCVYGSKEEAMPVLKRIKAGFLKWNGCFSGSAPFGGYKMSGVGREGGVEGLEEFLQTKVIGCMN